MKAWREGLAALFKLYTLAQREDFEIIALHLEGEAKDWWFSHLSHPKVIAYANLFQRLKKNFGRRKIETLPIIDEIVHEKPKEDLIIITPEEEPLPPPLAAKALASGGRALASLQDGLEILALDPHA